MYLKSVFFTIRKFSAFNNKFYHLNIIKALQLRPAIVENVFITIHGIQIITKGNVVYRCGKTSQSRFSWKKS